MHSKVLLPGTQSEPFSPPKRRGTHWNSSAKSKTLQKNPRNIKKYQDTTENHRKYPAWIHPVPMVFPCVSQRVSPFWIFLGGQVVSEKLHLVRHKGPIANLQASPGEGTWVTNVMAMSY